MSSTTVSENNNKTLQQPRTGPTQFISNVLTSLSSSFSKLRAPDPQEVTQLKEVLGRVSISEIRKEDRMEGTSSILYFVKNTKYLIKSEELTAALSRVEIFGDEFSSISYSAMIGINPADRQAKALFKLANRKFQQLYQAWLPTARGVALGFYDSEKFCEEFTHVQSKVNQGEKVQQIKGDCRGMEISLTRQEDGYVQVAIADKRNPSSFVYNADQSLSQEDIRKVWDKAIGKTSEATKEYPQFCCK